MTVCKCKSSIYPPFLRQQSSWGQDRSKGEIPSLLSYNILISFFKPFQRDNSSSAGRAAADDLWAIPLVFPGACSPGVAPRVALTPIMARLRSASEWTGADQWRTHPEQPVHLGCRKQPVHWPSSRCSSNPGLVQRFLQNFHLLRFTLLHIIQKTDISESL